MKKATWVMVAVMLLLTIGLVYSSNPQLFSFSFSTITSCPPGETLVTGYSEEYCGTTLVKSPWGTSGICQVYTCPYTVLDEAVSYCNVGISLQELQVPTNLMRLNPGGSIYYETECNYERADPGHFWLYREVWRERINLCNWCVVESCTDASCIPGQLRCASGTEIEVCTLPNDVSSCIHWEKQANCPDGKLCQQSTYGVDCVKTCSDDAFCDQQQYCEGGFCISKKADTVPCTENRECLSDYCHQESIFSNVCMTKTVDGEAGHTCDPSLAIYNPFECANCDGRWIEPGIVNNWVAMITGGEIEQAHCELALVGGIYIEDIAPHIVPIILSLLIFFIIWKGLKKHWSFGLLGAFISFLIIDFLLNIAWWQWMLLGIGGGVIIYLFGGAILSTIIIIIMALKRK